MSNIFRWCTELITIIVLVFYLLFNNIKTLDKSVGGGGPTDMIDYRSFIGLVAGKISSQISKDILPKNGDIIAIQSTKSYKIINRNPFIHDVTDMIDLLWEESKCIITFNCPYVYGNRTTCDWGSNFSEIQSYGVEQYFSIPLYRSFDVKVNYNSSGTIVEKNIKLLVVKNNVPSNFN